jgi:uncharacterized membrane protein
MDSAPAQTVRPTKRGKWWPFRRALLRGLGVVMPPLLTLVVFIWAFATIDTYILRPIETGFNRVFVFFAMRSGVQDTIPEDADPAQVYVFDRNNVRVATEAVLRSAGSVAGILSRTRVESWRVGSFEYDGVVYVPMPDQKWIPEEVWELVESQPGPRLPESASTQEVYERYVQAQYLPRWRTIPVFLVLFTAVLYLLGRFLAAGVGRIFVNGVESLISRLPLVRNVYSAVKQVTDFVFNEREFQFSHVVAVQYPREGVWSIGFVMGESFQDLRAAANEPVVAVLMPTSPMPATGFIITVRKSDTIDLNITLDQAIQFIVSCGVVSPPYQQPTDAGARLSAAIAQRLSEKSSGPSSTSTPPLPPAPDHPQ